MTDNLISTVSSFLTPEVVGKIASASGLDRSVMQTAVSAGVPAILGALANFVTRPGGASKLATAVAAQPQDLAGSLASGLSSGKQMATQGGSLLSSLLGSGTSGMLVSAIGRFLGISDGTAQTLMGFLTPVVMGVLGREQRSNNLDANGLARMLTEQKGQIAAAMPPGLASMLESGKTNEGTTRATPAEASTASAARSQQATTKPQRTTTDTKRSVNWAYWVVPLLVLAGLLWYWTLGQNNEPVRTSQPASTPTSVPPGAERQPVYYSRPLAGWTSAGTDANEYLNQEVYNKAGEQIGTIKNVLKAPDGKMVAAILTTGRALGIGDKEVAVSFPALQFEQQNNQRRIVVDTTRDALQAAPAYEQ